MTDVPDSSQVTSALDLLQSLVAALGEQLSESAALARPFGREQARAFKQQGQDAADARILAQACEVLNRRAGLL